MPSKSGKAAAKKAKAAAEHHRADRGFLHGDLDAILLALEFVEGVLGVVQTRRNLHAIGFGLDAGANDDLVAITGELRQGVDVDFVLPIAAATTVLWARARTCPQTSWYTAMCTCL